MCNRTTASAQILAPRQRRLTWLLLACALTGILPGAFAARAADATAAAPAAAPVAAAEPAFWKADFVKGVGGWVSEQPAQVSLQAGTPEAPLLRAQLLTPSNLTRYLYGPAIALPAADAFAGSTTVVLRGQLRASGDKGLTGEIKLLARQGETRQWVGQKRPKGSTLHLLPLPAQWQEFERRFVLPAGIADFRFYLCLSGEPGTIELRDLEARLETTRSHLVAGGENGLFFAEQGQLSVRIAAPDARPESVLRLENERGELLRETLVPAGTAAATVDLPGRGFYRLKVLARYPDGKTLETIATAAVTGTPLPAEKRIGSRYGLMDVHGDTTQAARLGAYWNWGFFNFGACKPGPDGEALPLPADPAKAPNPERQLIQAGGGETPEWLNPDQPRKGLYPPKDWAKFERMVTTWARSKTNLPNIVTVYNEPDAHWRGSTEELARYHSAVARGIRAGRPGTRVMGPCMYGIRMAYLKNLVQLGALNDLDGMVMHAYVDGTPPEDDFIHRVLELKDYLKSLGKENLPLYLTEFGWSTRQGTWQKPVDELTQARYVTRSLALLSAVKLDGLAYFCYQYLCDNPGEQGFSLLGEDNRPKPSACAFATLTRWLTGLRGESRWLRLTPQTHLILGEDERSAIAVVWNTAGETAVQLPSAPTAAEDYLGRPVACEGNALRIGADPVFLRLRETSLPRLTLLPELAVIRGKELTLAAPAQLVPAPLRQTGARLNVPADAPTGAYLLLGQAGGQWSAQPLHVSSPLQIASLTPAWPYPGEPELHAAVRSHLPVAVEGKLTLASGKPGKEQPLFQTLSQWKPEALTTVAIPLPGLRRVSGTLRVESAPVAGAPADRLSAPVDLRFAGASFGADPELPPVDSADWTRFGDFPARAAGTPADCAARLRASYGPDGLRLRIEVEDDLHQQKSPPEATWGEDSVQLAFDADVRKEWQPNNVGFGFNGHRICEYTVALTPRGPEAWRSIAYDPVLRPGLAEPRIRAQITRQGNLTAYDLLFPWATLGLEQAPARGGALGFALAINDQDGGGRHGLALHGGIIESKNPENFGTLWLR